MNNNNDTENVSPPSRVYRVYTLADGGRLRATMVVGEGGRALLAQFYQKHGCMAISDVTRQVGWLKPDLNIQELFVFFCAGICICCLSPRKQVFALSSHSWNSSAVPHGGMYRREVERFVVVKIRTATTTSLPPMSFDTRHMSGTAHCGRVPVYSSARVGGTTVHASLLARVHVEASRAYPPHRPRPYAISP